MATVRKINFVEQYNISSFSNVLAANIESVDGIDFFPPIGTRGVFAGGSDVGLINTISYITIASTGNSTNFGDLSTVREDLAACSNSEAGRGIFGGGDDGSRTNVIEYITISTPSNTTNFGDLTVATEQLGACSNGSGDRGVFGGGFAEGIGRTNVIEYITISTPGDASNFGDLTDEIGRITSTSNDTNNRGIFASGYVSTTEESNVITYITISSAGNATNFGDLTGEKTFVAATSNGINDRGVFAGGSTDIPGTFLNVIDYITISTPSNASNFGDLINEVYKLAACSSRTGDRGVFGGGDDNSDLNVIDYITISSASNATNFGDLTEKSQSLAGTNN